jgi:hypothetical protein
MPLRLYDRTDELGKQVLLLGRGDFGNGRKGVVGVDHTQDHTEALGTDGCVEYYA